MQADYLKLHSLQKKYIPWFKRFMITEEFWSSLFATVIVVDLLLTGIIGPVLLLHF